MKIWTAIVWDYRSNSSGSAKIKRVTSFATEKEALKHVLTCAPSMGRLKPTFDILMQHEEYREALRLANLEIEVGTIHESDLTGHALE
jgi:hypothetical protein